MPYCAAPKCKYRSFSKRKNQCEFEAKHKITFHLFPKNIDKRKIWIGRMGLTDKSIPKYAYLCSRHFSPESFDRTSACKVRLKDDAIPNVCILEDAVLEETCSIKIEENTRKRECSETTETFPIDGVASASETLESNITIDTEITKVEHCEAAEPSAIDRVSEPANKRSRIDSSAKDCNKKNASSQTPQPPRCIDKATWVSKSLIASSPTKEHLRNIIKEQKKSYLKEIKLLKQTAQRTEKRIASLKDVMVELRKHKDLNLEKLDVLNGIGTSNVDLLKRVVKKSMHATLPKQFTPEQVRAFALTLHYYSARAYNYVRKKFDSRLPHPKTLSKWYRSINGEPGFNTECLNAIKERAKIVDNLLVGSLVFDEMS